MKTIKFIVAVAIAFSSFTLPATAIGLPASEIPSDTNATETMPEAAPAAVIEEPLPDSTQKAIFEDTGPDIIMPKEPPEKHIVGEVSYVSGGVGEDEAREMKQLTKSYPLEVIFVQKANREETDRIEAYIAEVRLQIKNAKGNVVLDITTDGPILLADLPPGKYTLTAEYNNVTKTNHVHIATKKHQKLVFWWPM